MSGPLKMVETTQAPRPVGPYSQGVKVGGFLFVAGQIGQDPKTGELVAGGIEAQTVRAIDNMEAVLKAAGTGLSGVCSVDVSLANLTDLPTFNLIYTKRFNFKVRPARTMRRAAGLTRDALVEISCIACLEKG